MLKQALIPKGKTPETAQQGAYVIMKGSVMKQAAVLSYMDVFLYIGLLFLICIPFVMIVKSNKKAGNLDMSNAH